jgi:tight adherence protein C
VSLTVIVVLASMFVFGAVVLLIVGLRQTGRVDPLASRLQALQGDTAAEGLPWWAHRRLRKSWLERVLSRLAGFLPNASGEDSIRDGLSEAGYRSGNAVTVFLGAKVALAVLLPVVFFAVMSATGNPFGGQKLALGLALGVLGFYLPTLWLWDKSNKRKLEIQHTLPDALDLMVVCVEAGLGLDAAMVKVAQEVNLSSPVLSGELRLVNQEMRTGAARIDALRNLARRTGVQDIQSLVAVLVQADRLGTSIATALRSQSDSLRVRRRQRAEEQAHKTGVKLVFPLVLCIFPGLLVILLAPAMLRVIKSLTSVGGP